MAHMNIDKLPIGTVIDVMHIDAVKPIIKLDRLYPDPIAFRLMW